MSGRYSAFALLHQGFARHQGWPQAWRKRRALGSGQVGEKLPLMTQSLEFPLSAERRRLAAARRHRAARRGREPVR